MSAQHTPGPWIARMQQSRAGNDLGWIIERGNDRIGWASLAKVVFGKIRVREEAEEDAANAKLIAAAPRMRELLQEALMPDLSKPLRDHSEWLKDVRDLLEDEIGEP